MSVLKIYDDNTSQWIEIPSIKGDSGTYYGTTEPVNPNINVWIDPSGDADYGSLPSGGTAGQALVKASSSNFEAVWSNIESTPSGGASGAFLIKNSNDNYDVTWSTALTPVGNIILTSDVHYYASVSALPSAGIAGRVAFVKVT